MSLTLISGGQTGADRTALEIAEDLQIPTGGWCPSGGRTDDGDDPTLMSRFHLTETNDRGYHNRTVMNVRDAELILWFGDSTSAGGRLTFESARELCVPCLDCPDKTVILSHLLHPDYRARVQILMVAGNRRRTNPRIIEEVRMILKPALEEYLRLVIV